MMRVTGITNSNSAITRTYFNDNLLNTESDKYGDNITRTVTYSYDPDGRRASLGYPNGTYNFSYTYTGRSQLNTIVSGSDTVADYGYDPNGNLTSRILDNNTSCSYGYDALNRCISISHALVGTTRTFAYGYDTPKVGNLGWVKRDGNLGDAFDYDLNDQAMAVKLNIANPDAAGAPGAQTINYDAAGNRTTFSAYGPPTQTYAVNNLNQYTTRNSSSASYDPNGNMKTGLDGSTYTYDAQNRLLTASTNGTTDKFLYDGLNRQIGKQIGSQAWYYRVYDGWDLLGEYKTGTSNAIYAYLYGAGGLVKNVATNNYYYQDASGSTSHVANSAGALKEYYIYDLQGQPTFYNASGTKLSDTAIGVRHLFTGQQWYTELGLYDLRYRYYSPDIGRFLQTDPIGFDGDYAHLYRYCGNNPIDYADPTGELANFVVGALIGGGVDLGIQLIVNGGNLSQVSWSQVGISAAVGALTSGASAFISSSFTATVARVGLNAAANAAIGSVAQVAVNATSGKPLTYGVRTTAVFGLVAGGAGSFTSELANLSSGNLTSALEAAAIAFDNSTAIINLFPSPPLGNRDIQYYDARGNLVEVDPGAEVNVVGQPVPVYSNGNSQSTGPNSVSTSVASGSVTVSGFPISANSVTSGNGITLGTFGYGSAGIGSGVVEIGLGGGADPLETEVLLRMH